MVRVRAGFLSVTGNVRENNEDRYLADPRGRFYLVADGMGGQSAGEKASEMATELLSIKLDKLIDFAKSPKKKVEEAINRAIIETNIEIIALGSADPNYHNMGTTIVLAALVGDLIYVSNVGDSRAYLLRGTDLEQLTVDHSVTQALVKSGIITPEEAPNHRYRNMLYRYLGTKEGGTGVDVYELSPQPGDRLMLCSDGVTDGLDDSALMELLAANSDPQVAAETIVQAALDGGSKDNVTCLVLSVE